MKTLIVVFLIAAFIHGSALAAVLTAASLVLLWRIGSWANGV